MTNLKDTHSNSSAAKEEDKQENSKAMAASTSILDSISSFFTSSSSSAAALKKESDGCELNDTEAEAELRRAKIDDAGPLIEILPNLVSGSI